MPPIVQKRLLGKEDCDFDFNGTNETRTTIDGSGNSIEVTKLNDSHIPTLAALRANVGGAVNINAALDYLATLVNDIGSATLTKEGLIELATSAEALALTDPSRAITPAALGVLLATETQKGISQFATQAEVNAGTLTNKLLAPINKATEVNRGTTQFATEAEVATGTETAKAVSPANMPKGSKVAIFKDKKSNGVIGGASATGVQTRTLNFSEPNNNADGVSRSGNNITLQGGKVYDVLVFVPQGVGCGLNQSFINYVSGEVFSAIYSTSGYNAINANLIQVIKHTFIPTADTTFNISHNIELAAGLGLGQACSRGYEEVYTTVIVNERSA